MTTFLPHFYKIAGLRPGQTRLLIACAALLAAPGSPLLRTALAAPAPAADASPAAADAPLDPLDVAKLRPHLNDQVVVRGTPTTSGQNKPGTIAYLNFAAAHQAVALVFFLKPGQSGKASSVDDLKPFVGKPVIVKGTLTDYKGDLQIVVDSLDQIKVAP